MKATYEKKQRKRLRRGGRMINLTNKGRTFIRNKVGKEVQMQ